MEAGLFTAAIYPLTIQPDFSTVTSVTEASREDPLISFTPNDSIRDLLGFNPETFYGN